MASLTSADYNRSLPMVDRPPPLPAEHLAFTLKRAFFKTQRRCLVHGILENASTGIESFLASNFEILFRLRHKSGSLTGERPMMKHHCEAVINRSQTSGKFDWIHLFGEQEILSAKLLHGIDGKIHFINRFLMFSQKMQNVSPGVEDLGRRISLECDGAINVLERFGKFALNQRADVRPMVERFQIRFRESSRPRSDPSGSFRIVKTDSNHSSHSIPSMPEGFGAIAHSHP